MPKPINPYAVLVRPLITEKGTMLSGQDKYPFEVHREANKLQIKEAVELAFSVKVRSVNTLTVHGKMKKRGRYRLASTSRSWKKAIVTLEPGQKIEFYSGV
jgi:large subunit ribosomal protein L23